MPSFPRIRSRVVTACLAACVAAPAGVAAADGSGGAQYGAPGSAATQAPAIAGDARFYSRAQAMLGSTLRFHGVAAAGAQVEVDVLDAKAGAWVRAATATAGPDGSYVAAWKATRAGALSVRAVVLGGPGTAAAAPSPIAVTVYRRAKATWFGPGMYGRKTACGVRLTRTLLGIANRSLPCGTKVAVYYRGRTIVLPVVDRGPFDRGASWDLTGAAATALGFKVSDSIGAVSLPAAPAPAPAAPAP